MQLVSKLSKKSKQIISSFKNRDNLTSITNVFGCTFYRDFVRKVCEAKLVEVQDDWRNGVPHIYQAQLDWLSSCIFYTLCIRYNTCAARNLGFIWHRACQRGLNEWRQVKTNPEVDIMCKVSWKYSSDGTAKSHLVTCCYVIDN